MASPEPNGRATGGAPASKVARAQAPVGLPVALAAVLMAACAVLAVLALVPRLQAFGRADAGRPGATANRGAVRDLGVTVADLAYDPTRYVGRTVTVVAAVGNVLDRQAFVLRDARVVGQPEVLVVSAGALELVGPPAAPGGDVLVTGTVFLFDPARVERELGVPFDAGAARLQRFTGQPALRTRPEHVIPAPRTSPTPRPVA